VTQAVCEQVSKLVHAQVNIVMHNRSLELVNKLRPLMPKGLDTFFFWNSGSEAVEAAVKLARHATGKPNIIVMQGGYHGRTIGTMGLTSSKTIYKERFGPFMPGVHVLPFPYATQLGLNRNTTQKQVHQELEMRA
jgi:4-aminobutyrate aminotransferase